MTSYSDFARIVVAIKSAYSRYQTLLCDENSIQLWYSMLKDIDAPVLSEVVKKYISSEKYPPTIADIRQLASEVMCEPIEDWSSCWGTVRRLIHQCGMYQEERALSLMDDMTKETVKRLGWRSLCISENAEVDRANFRMVYEQIAEGKRNKNLLPENVVKRLGMLREENREKRLEDKGMEGEGEREREKKRANENEQRQLMGVREVLERLGKKGE